MLIMTAEPGSTVSLLSGINLLGSSIADETTGEFSISSSVLSDGAYSFTVIATDASGNVSAESSALAI